MTIFNSLSVKKIAISSFLIFLIISISFSQNSPYNTNSFWKNVQFGGGIGLNFGDSFFSSGLSPAALYRFNPYVASGIGLNFQYSSQKDVFKSTVFGGSIIGLFNPYKELQISTELEQLFVSRNFDEQFVSNVDDSYSYPALFLGLGYTSRNITFGIRFDILYDKYKSIQNEAWMPFVRFWF